MMAVRARQLDLTPAQARKKVIAVHWELVKASYGLKGMPPAPLGTDYFSAELKRFWQGEIVSLHDWWSFNWIWDAIVDAMRWVWDNVFAPAIDALLAGLGWIADRAKDVIVGVLKIAAAVGGWLWGAIKGAVGFIWEGLQGVWNFLVDVAQAAWNGITSAVGRVWDFICGIGSVIAGAVKGFFDWLWSAVQGVAQWIWDKLVTVGNWIWDAVSAAWDALKSWLGTIMGEIIDAVKGALGFLGEVFMALGKVIWDALKWFWDNVLVPAGQAVIKGLEWIWSKITEIVSSITQALLSICRSWAPMTPERSENAFAEIGKILAASVIGLGGLTLIGEAVHPLKQLGFPHISAMVYDLSGFKLITGAAMSALGFCMFKQPMTYLFSNIFRPRMPAQMDIITARSRDLIDAERAKRMMGYQGFSDDYYYIWEDMAKTPLKYFALRAVAAGGFYDPEFFEVDMKRSGYFKDSRDALHEMYFATAIEKVTKPVISQLQKRFINGYVREAEYDEELHSWFVPPAQRPVYIRAGHMLRDLKLRDQLVKNALDAYDRGAVEDVGLLQALGEANIPGELAQQILANERQKRGEDKYQTREEEVRAYGSGICMKRFREGIDNDIAFRTNMMLGGYTSGQIERYLIFARLDYDYDYAMDLLAVAKDAYWKGLIVDDEFLDWLARIPIGAERAQTYLMRERIRKEKKIAS